ncbi:hypothetical protein BG005_007389 [Podila minutissima]|nr:hypothetical protein BG005_007389 [Podila minutissima]
MTYQSTDQHTMKTSADRSTRSLSIGTLNIHIVAHRFFHIVDARHWHQVETFHHYRDISLSAQRHADIYKADLERISDHDSVPGPLRKTASNLLKHFKNDEFVDKFSKITDMVGERRANRGVRSLLFGVAENVGAPPVQSVEDQIGEDDSTLDGHQDFEFAAVNNDGETDRDQEAEESDDVDDDELGEIILPHDFHGLFEALYRAANKQTFRIPKMPKMESTLKTTLFQYVKDLLTVYHDLPRVRQKDLYVAASSVVYLHCSGSETIFKAHDMPNLLEMTKETEMAIPSTALSDLLMTLKEQARDDQGIFDVRQLVDLIDIEKGSLATKRHQGQKIDVTVKLAIDVLQSVAPLCVADPIRRPVDTEQKSQGVWERVFNIIFAKTAVTAVIGETGLEGSGEARSQNEADHAVERLKGDKEKEMDRKKEFPRKVDCKFVVSVERMKRWEFITISNSEMKALRSTADEVEVMVRKNIRHNHLIINQIGTPKILFCKSDVVT